MKLSQLRIVLVETSHPGNVGAAARAMKNMGQERLYLVSPKDFPSGVAVGRAAGALDVLDQAKVVESLEEAIHDCGLVIGASARSRSLPWPLLEPAECARKIVAAAGRNEVALVFGREDRGLANEELQSCHFHVQIPASEDYPSLNLAAAVMILCYELRKALTAASSEGADGGGDEAQGWDQELATVAELEGFLKHLERVLTRIDFHDPANPRQLMPRLGRLYRRVRLDRMEVNILRGILAALEQELDR